MKPSTRAQSSILAIDVGNTAIKLGQYHWPPSSSATADSTESANSSAAGGVTDCVADATRPTEADAASATAAAAARPVLRLASAEPDWRALQDWLQFEPLAAFVVSVCPPAADRLMNWMGRAFPNCELCTFQWTDFPLRVAVDYPDRVGQDRLAAAVAANQLKSLDRAAIVVDAGSAITVDLVSPAGDFCGGAILPGWQTMARSLATSTHLLPYVETGAFPAAPAVIGRSTESAIVSGLYWGSVGAVRELVDRMSQPWSPTPERLIAGGDMQALLPYLGPAYRCVPDMVLRGIVQTAAVRAGFAAAPCQSES